MADFGLSRTLSKDNAPLSKEIATLWYWAPEIILGWTNYNEAVDSWAIGCLFFELIAKIPLFYAENDEDLLYWIFKVLGTPSSIELPEI